MFTTVQPALLAIGIEGLPKRSSAIDVYAASSLREIVSTMRLISFDLVVVGLDDPHLDVWEAMHRVLAAWPHQRWMLASSQVTQEEEILARSLGAAVVLDSVPDECWFVEFASSLRRREPEAGISPLASSLRSPAVLQAGWGAVEA
jgi:DNA-binding NarL/FixJ family response regulator